MAKPNNKIYLDNNGTTVCCNLSAKTVAKWIQCGGNPSGSSKLSVTAKKMIEDSTEYIKTHNKAHEFEIVFTSGGSESNCLIIDAIVNSWLCNLKRKPHIITSSVEHKSILLKLQELVKLRRIDVSIIEPDCWGIIHPAAVEQAIKKNTALVTIMFANNELGAINPVSQIGEIAHKYKIPFHTDAVQIYGKYSIKLDNSTIDAMSCSFHKLYGPTGIGILFIRKSLIDGYKLVGQIAGTQQNGLRGGTENVHGIAGAVAAMQWNFNNRSKKNEDLCKMRTQLIDLLAKKFMIISYDLLAGVENPKRPEDSKEGEKAICILGPPNQKMVLCNTILMSVLDWDHMFCNVKFKNLLEKNGITVSIGSACNTHSAKASHVLDAVKAPKIVKRGIMRISIGDYNTLAEIKQFAEFIIYALQSTKLDIYLDDKN